MENLWRIVPNEDLITPYKYVKQQCSYLSEATENKLIGRIKEYNGEYRSNCSITQSYIPWESPFSSQEKAFDIQEELGDKNSRFVYEFYITSQNNPQYKYRILFMAYGISIYPTFISLEKSVAEELSCGTEFYIENEDGFKEFLQKVLATKRVSGVVSNLLSMAE